MRPQTDRQTETDTQTRVATIHFASSTTHAKCNNARTHLQRKITGCSCFCFFNFRFYTRKWFASTHTASASALQRRRFVNRNSRSANHVGRTCRPSAGHGLLVNHPLQAQHERALGWPRLMATWADRCLRPAVQRVELNYDAAVGRHMTAPASWTTRRLLLSRYGLVAVGDSVHSSLSCLSRYRETRYSGAVMTYFAKRRINEVSYIAQYFHDS